MPGSEGATQERIVVRGRVQGVGFRFFARDIALSLGLRGTVRNLPDGQAVEAVIQGEPAALRSFVAAMERGPSGAYVDSVDVTPEEIDPALGSFRITPGR